MGAPSTPGPAVFTRPAKICPAAACRSSAARPCTPAFIPPSRALGNEASAGVHSRSPVRSSPRLRPRMGRARFGFCPELRTPQLPATHVRAGTDLEHWPGAIPPTSSALQPQAHSQHATSCRTPSAQSIPQNTAIDPPWLAGLLPVPAGQAAQSHARALMEGLDGPPSDQPFVTPAARRAPVPAGARMAPVAERGQSCGWLRPRPPIPGPVIQPAEPARRVADGDAGARISSQGSWPCAGGGRGSPGTSVLPSHASPAGPGTRQSSSSAASAGTGKASLREQARHHWFAGAAGLHLWLTALARCQAPARNHNSPISEISY
jgi:hypothetical protein